MRLALMLVLLVSGTACRSPSRILSTRGQAHVDFDIVERMPEERLSYADEVRPILDRRCVVCHGCYDAPCQLKLTSAEGIARGGSKDRVYDGSRLMPMRPTRLFVDALTTEEWRALDFHPVVADDPGGPYANLEASTLYRMLRLKQRHPQPLVGMLPRRIDTGLNREQYCPTLEEMRDYERERPLQGMPFALPNLSTEEYETLVTWIAQGSHTTAPPPPADVALAQVRAWEELLNRRDPKHQLVARYLYEHWFLGHLHFEGDDPRSFFSIVRSSTPPGQPIVPVATRRPYDDPGPSFHYRFQPITSTIVAKDHLLYELSEARLARVHELFFEPSYEVRELPGRGPRVASNPFRAFAALPLRSRYQFLLDDARFFLEGFMKGPVCRGQVALNVIEDRFWILFFDPDAPISTNDEYVNQLARLLAMPTELEDNLRLVRTYRHYLDLENRYLNRRREAFSIDRAYPIDEAMNALWRGDGTNRSAALTVYRHLDSASVDFGLVGDVPETAWVLDYPLLERIHYLLVAGFDVYGNVGHQLNTRMFMDVLRMEAEDYFLAFMPQARRKSMHESWYVGIREGQDDDTRTWWLDREFVTGYRTDDPMRELFTHVRDYLGPLAEHGRQRPCGAACADPARDETVARVDRAMFALHHIEGEAKAYVADVAYVRVRLGGDPADDLAYTLLSDKSYRNVSWMLSEEELNERRDYSHDRQTVVPWLEGAYPNFFFVVDHDEVDAFVRDYHGIQSRRDYERFVALYGIRRTNPTLWEHADWFHDQALREEPRRGGILDLNRYQNR
ncbi:MAG: fatty acid cis/trans isomerase [Sandaracinus sp.]|nr:fatty acid cis/trans isomerase [Sandaracinus sp.]MCB9616004.1 fatty acid cis/trans isomerase [Sandaracinus sp.]